MGMAQSVPASLVMGLEEVSHTRVRGVGVAERAHRHWLTSPVAAPPYRHAPIRSFTHTITHA